MSKTGFRVGWLPLFLLAPLLTACGDRQTPGDGATAAQSPIMKTGFGQPHSKQSDPLVPDDTAPHDLRLGRAVFARTCLICHGEGGDDAPKLGDASDWEARVQQDQTILVQHAIEGYGRMPPKGGFDTLSDAEVAAAVAYAVDRSRKIVIAQKNRQRAADCHPVKDPANCTDLKLADVLTLQMLRLLGSRQYR